MPAIERIATLKDEIDLRQREILTLRRACEHDYRPSDPKSLESSSPICALCGDERFGWWCEKSPTKECNYQCLEGDKSRSFRSYNPDSCRYCGQPSERK